MFGDGFIPAHAGKTVGHRLQHQDRRAHPRSRGENAAHATFAAPMMGSSPLTRGKQWDGVSRIETYRLIPAHAGKTVPRSPQLSTPRAHPRSRGENEDVGLEQIGGDGSSPLTRGKPVIVAGNVAAGGLIPAHAGKTWPMPLTSRARLAHPRSRGENFGIESQ